MSKVERLSDDILCWLPALSAMRSGGLESLIKAISGLGQVGPKPEFAPGANADTWPRVRHALENAGLIEAIPTGHTEAPYLRFHPDLQTWLATNPDTDARLRTTRNHQRHYFQFAGQLNQRRHREPEASAALTHLELTNLRAAAEGVLEQGEEWALEFVNRLGVLLDDIGEPWSELRERAEQLAARLGAEPWRLHLSNRAQLLFDKGDFRSAENLLQELLDGLNDGAGFERASAWARIAQCRLRDERREDARHALLMAAELCAGLPASDALAEMRRDLCLDRIPVSDEVEARECWRQAIEAHAALTATRENLAEYSDFIERVRLACESPAAADDIAQELDEARSAGWRAGADAIAALIVGERDLFKLSATLDLDDAALIAETLRGIAD